MTSQLAFDLPVTEAYRREDFFVSAAISQALAVIDGWREWPGGKLLLIGPEGAGKTHLAHIWAEATGAKVIAAGVLAQADLPVLAQSAAVCVEDAEAIADDRAAQTALFHLHNLLAPAGRLLITAASPPRDWGNILPDLQSRLQAAALTRLNAPDDALLAAVLVKLFADRQIVVAPNVIAYLITRIERSIATARRVVIQLDAVSLTLGRPITRALAAEVLDKAVQG